jgi:hypothetical protein
MQKRLQKAVGVSEKRTTFEDDGDSPKLLGWKEFAKTGLP